MRKILVTILCVMMTVSALAQIKTKTCGAAQGGGGGTAVTDDFNRASLGTNWTVNGGGSIYSSTEFQFTAGSGLEYAFYNAATFADNQYSQVQLSNLSTAANKMGPAVRISADGQSLYTVRCYVTLCEWYKFNSSTGNDFGGKVIGNYTPSAGDTIRVEAVGTTISVYRCVDGAACTNKTALGTSNNSVTDGTLTSGKPGVHGNYIDNSAGTNGRVDNWKGGDL